jgi:hypothetical protein
LDKIVLPTNMGREESGLMKISFYLNLFLTFLPSLPARRPSVCWMDRTQELTNG